MENELLEHATRLFAERGFAGTSLQDIADALGITRPALYYYVKSKDELLARLVTEVTEDPLSILTELVARTDLDPADKLSEFVRFIVARRGEHPERFRLLVRSEAELPKELATANETSRRAALRSIERIIEDGVRIRRFRPVDARVAALGVLGMCNWVAWWFNADRDDLDAVADQLVDMALAGLTYPEDHAARGTGPQAAIAALRQDLDYLERILRT